MRVKDCMCGEVCWVKPDTKISEIAKIMEKNHIGCVPVCDEQNSLVGIITDRDIILRTIACDKDAKTTNASEIMTTDICCCNQEDEVYDVECTMSQNQVRRIPVVENNKVIGILTFGDLTHYCDEIGEDEFCSTAENICECGGQAKNNC